jgi:hypothetical protein
MKNAALCRLMTGIMVVQGTLFGQGFMRIACPLLLFIVCFV